MFLNMTDYSSFNIIDPDHLTNFQGPPTDFFAWIRKNEPVYWNPVNEAYNPPVVGGALTQGFYILSRYKDVMEVSRNSTVFSSYEGGPMIWDLEPEMLQIQRSGLMSMDGPMHMGLKSMIIPSFALRRLNEYKPQIVEKAKAIIDKVAKNGECELVFDVASRLPVATFCELMGVPEKDHEFVFTLGNRLADIETEKETNNLEDQMALFAYCEKLSEQKRQNPDNSILSRYIHRGTFPQQVINMVFVTFSIAGHETTRNTLVHFFRLMNEHPDQYELLKSDIDKYIAGAINEVLRYCPPVMNFRRTCLSDVEIGGKQLKKGDKVYLSYVSACRDEAIFDNPDRFDITRPNAHRHLAFGIGPHACAGARLATMQLEIMIREIINRIPDIQPSEPHEYLRSIWFHAIKKCPMKFTPET